MTSTLDPGTVAAGLGDWLRQHFDGPVELVGVPGAATEGFDSAIYFVRYAAPTLPAEWQQPLVVRLKPRPDALAAARLEGAVHAWLADHGYPVPRMLEVFAAGEITDRPTQVVARAPGVMMLDDVKRAPWTTRRRLRQLAGLHVRLHALPTDGYPDPTELVDRRLALPRRLAGELADPALGEAMERVEALVPRLRAAPSNVCHGDFHPLNVLVDGSAASVIDWTDAGLGDRHGDVARTLLLFELAAIAASNRAEQVVLGRAGPLMAAAYRRAYAGVLPLDGRRLALWRPVHLVHFWAQTLGAHAGGDGLAERLPQDLLQGLRRRFDAAIAAV